MPKSDCNDPVDSVVRQRQLGVVIPLYNEIECLEPLIGRLKVTLQPLDYQWTVWFVDDGSRDGTALRLESVCQMDPRFHWIRLSRNFGQPAAIAAGLRSATGDCVVLMDGDLQDPPELIPDLLKASEAGYQVVLAQRQRRHEKGIRGVCLRSFHRVFRLLADAEIESNTGTFCLLDRRAVDAINQLPEAHRYFPGLRYWIGWKQTTVKFDRPDRIAGEPKQTFRRLIRHAADAIFSYSFKPLRMVTLVGVAICGMSFLLAMFFVLKRLMGMETASIGFTSLTTAVLGIGGFQLISVGILGEYIGRIYEEVKRRPPYIVAAKSDERPSTAWDVNHHRKAG